MKYKIRYTLMTLIFFGILTWDLVYEYNKPIPVTAAPHPVVRTVTIKHLIAPKYVPPVTPAPPDVTPVATSTATSTSPTATSTPATPATSTPPTATTTPTTATSTKNKPPPKRPPSPPREPPIIKPVHEIGL